MSLGRFSFALLLVISVTLLGACQGGSIDNGLDDGLSADGPADNYPAATHPALLQVTSAGGNVLQSPTLQVVTFNNDPNAADLEAFATKLAASSYWTAATSEYGVASLNVAAPQRATFAWPASSTDGSILGGQSSDVENYLLSQLDGASPAWGKPNANTIYVLFMPAGIKVSPDGGQTPSACTADILAWHTALLLPQSNVTINYVVQPYCGTLTGLSALDSRTFAASHEIITTATNPHLNGYSALDANHAFYALVAGSADVASVCAAQQYGNANLAAKPADLPYAVQRTWSNAQAKAGHVPCVPAADNEVFFDAVPVLTTSVSATVSSNALVAPVKTLGVQIATGAKGTVDLALFADGNVANPWTVDASEIGTSDLTLSLDKSTGGNNDVLHLSITVNAAPKSAQELVRITSTLSGRTNNEYILVHN